MKTAKLPSLVGRRRKAVALVTVLSVLSLIMILITAMLSVTRVEHKSTVAQVEGDKARLQADSVLNLVIGQLQSVTRQDAATSGREIWTSQPGMVRQYKEDGTLLRGAKLYSDSNMVARTEAEIAADLPPTDWDKRPAQYVDLNEPVVRADLRNPAAPPRVYFPIIDPRAFSSTQATTVEEFSYSQSVDGSNGQNLNGVVLPTNGKENDQRVPMPVEWLYMLKDGTLGFVDAEGTFKGPNQKQATRDNPIVSRLAFWTDDESTKININTAGEGTYWSTPRLYHERDGDWARYQPMSYEYQRYPGHPATVCMSTVLFPHENMNPIVRDETNFKRSLNYKESIYDLMPKILPGGSKAGSELVPVGRKNFRPTDFREVQKALGERLFPSADEFLLRAAAQQDSERPEIDLGVGRLWGGLPTSEVVERLRSFLTPNSSAPETNPFGMPKISMWPIHRNTGNDYRSVFDRAIVTASTLAGRDYFFTRQDSTSQGELISILRNRQLFDYLVALTDQPIPGFGEAGATFARKYGQNREQILIEIFDYIRSTNLYDDNLAEENVGSYPAIPGLPTSRQTAYTAGMAAKTFTPMRTADSRSSYPGHGQVMPTVLPRTGQEVYRGMGRFITISEVGLHFITTAEGTNNAGGLTSPRITPKSAPGYTPPTWRGGAWGDYGNWYSNFPPLSAANQKAENGFYKAQYPTTHNLEGFEGNDPKHPGYMPMNWNWTLDKDKPLPNGTKRVQASFLLEWFSPSAGWTLLHPDFQIVVDASSLKVGGKPMFPNSGNKVILRPFYNPSDAWGVHQRGGTISYRAFLQGRKLPAVAAGVNGYTSGSLQEDTNYRSYASRSGIEKDCIQCNLVSDFFDIPAGQKINFSGGTVVVKLYSSRVNPEQSSVLPLQQFNFKFPAAGFVAPNLVTKNEDTSYTTNWDNSINLRQPVPAPYWWAFHADGAIGRDVNGLITSAAATDASRMGGRFRFIGNEIGSYGSTPGSGTYNRGNLVTPDDCLQSLVLRHGDPRLTMGQFNVPDTEFQPHRFYGQQLMAHNIVLAHWSEGPGLDRGEDKKGWRLVKDANYAFNFLPDHPYSAACGAGLQKYGDFDRGITNQTDGAYINKPDEGNTFGKEVNSTTSSGTTSQLAVPYFTESYNNMMAGAAYFSPNRQVSSPGMFGSLPTGVHESSGSIAARREPWRTLLFRPQTWSTKQGQKFHPGAPKTLKGYGTRGLGMQGIDPPDYLFMDFFWMPVVEPYAISSPGSTVGKINLNYQMAPFRHIRRATGLAAVLKSEVITAVPVTHAPNYLSPPPNPPSDQSQTWFWREDSSAQGGRYWHRAVDTTATLKLFDERFSSGFAFISPAQICEMHLLPKRTNAADTLVPEKWADNINSLLQPSGNSILKFWEDHAITAENLRERPYANIYPRVTTRSNTFQVHMRVQTLKKARSTPPDKFVPGTDLVASEYRGSAVVERYLDLNDPALNTANRLDYASGNPLTKDSLDELHRFRIISQKRFDP